MKMKRWMMTALLGAMALFAVSTNSMGSNGALIPDTNTIKSVKDNMAHIGKVVLQQVKAFVPFMQEQEAINAAAKETLWFADQAKVGISMNTVQGDLPAISELPQPIRKISGILIQTDQASINKILRAKEYRGSG